MRNAAIGRVIPWVMAALAAVPGTAIGQDAPLVAEVPAEYRLVEGIAYDPVKDRLFAATVIDGRLTFREQGRWREVALGLPRAGFFGIAIDPARRLLWLTTGSVEQTAVAGERMAGLIAVDLDALAVVRRVPLAAGGQGTPGDLAIAADGTVFVTDAGSGAVHRCRPGCTVLDDLLPAGTYRSPQGIVVAPDGKHLIVADYSTGLHWIDPETGRDALMEVPPGPHLKGVDGLITVPGGTALIAIQNGTATRRILRIRLDSAGDRVVGVELLEAMAPDAGEPTLGLLKDGALWFIADGQWERYGAGGALKDGKPARPTPIRALPLP